MASGEIRLRSPVSSQYTFGSSDSDSIKCNGSNIGQSATKQGYIRRIGNLIIFSFYVQVTTAFASNSDRVIFAIKDSSLWPDALEDNGESIHATVSHSTGDHTGTVSSYDVCFEPDRSSANIYVRTPMPVGYVSGTMIWTI